MEDLLTLGKGRRVIDVDDGLFDPFQGFEGPADDVLPRLGQDLDGDVVGNQIMID